MIISGKVKEHYILIFFPQSFARFVQAGVGGDVYCKVKLVRWCMWMCKDTVQRNAWMVDCGALCFNSSLSERKRKKVTVQRGKGNQRECSDTDCFLWPAPAISGDFVFLLSILNPPAL